MTDPVHCFPGVSVAFSLVNALKIDSIIVDATFRAVGAVDLLGRLPGFPGMTARSKGSLGTRHGLEWGFQQLSCQLDSVELV